MANKVYPNRSTLSYVGSITPDAVPDWHIKDITHFRNLPDRSTALAELAQKTNRDNEFDEAVLLHLYLDWKWDTNPRDKYISMLGDDWFEKYRNEVSLSSGYAFHHTPWAKDVWNNIYRCDTNLYGDTPGADKQQVRDFIIRSTNWHFTNNIGPSKIFTPEFIYEFTSQTAQEYINWRNEH